MLRNFSNSLAKHKVLVAVLLPIWVMAGFLLSQVLVTMVLTLLRDIGADFSSINQAVLSSVVAAMIYILSIIIVIWLPWKVKKFKTTKDDLGLNSQPTWLHLILAPAGFVVYAVVLAVVVMVAQILLPFVD